MQSGPIFGKCHVRLHESYCASSELEVTRVARFLGYSHCCGLQDSCGQLVGMGVSVNVTHIQHFTPIHNVWTVRACWQASCARIAHARGRKRVPESRRPLSMKCFGLEPKWLRKFNTISHVVFYMILNLVFHWNFNVGFNISWDVGIYVSANVAFI